LPPQEIVLVDDSSTDRSFEIAKLLSQKYPKVKIYKNNNKKGISGATNTALDKSSGDLIAYLDQDDTSLPDRFLKQFNLLKDELTVSVCGTWMQEFGVSTDIWKYPTQDKEIKPLLLLHSPVANPTVMIRREVFEKNNIYYRSEYDAAQDFDFWVRIFPYVKFAVIPEVLVKYRIHSENTSTTKGEEQYEAWREAIKPLIEKLGVLFDNEMYRTLYNFKYSRFKETYKKDKRDIDLLISTLIEANGRKNIFDQESLNRLFTNKISDWNA